MSSQRAFDLPPSEIEAKLDAEARQRMRVGMWTRGGLPPNHNKRIVGAKVDCRGHVLEVRRELGDGDSSTAAWLAVKDELAKLYVERWLEEEKRGC